MGQKDKSQRDNRVRDEISCLCHNLPALLAVQVLGSHGRRCLCSCVVCYPDCDPCTNSNDTNKRKKAGGERKRYSIKKKNSSPCSPIFVLLSSLDWALYLLWRIALLCCTIKPNNSNIITAISAFSLLPFSSSNILTFFEHSQTPSISGHFLCPFHAVHGWNEHILKASRTSRPRHTLHNQSIRFFVHLYFNLPS